MDVPSAVREKLVATEGSANRTLIEKRQSRSWSDNIAVTGCSLLGENEGAFLTFCNRPAGCLVFPQHHCGLIVLVDEATTTLLLSCLLQRLRSRLPGSLQEVVGIKIPFLFKIWGFFLVKHVWHLTIKWVKNHPVEIIVLHEFYQCPVNEFWLEKEGHILI